jgi:hypothetical protein
MTPMILPLGCREVVPTTYLIFLRAQREYLVSLRANSTHLDEHVVLLSALSPVHHSPTTTGELHLELASASRAAFGVRCAGANGQEAKECGAKLWRMRVLLMCNFTLGD